MSVLFLEEPPEVSELIARRRELGLDGPDEVWEGTYVVVPHANLRHARVAAELAYVLGAKTRDTSLAVGAEFNLGQADDYRVPDLGVFDGSPQGVYAPTAEVVVEILSPDDKTFEKFDFYARHYVDEILVVKPDERKVTCYRRSTNSVGEAVYKSSFWSKVLDVACEVLDEEIRWP